MSTHLTGIMMLLGCTIILLAIVAHAEGPLGQNRTAPAPRTEPTPAPAPAPRTEPLCCPPGSFPSQTESTETCEECPVGQFQEKMGENCRTCKVANFQYTDETGQTACKVCGMKQKGEEAIGHFWNKKYHPAPRCGK